MRQHLIAAIVIGASVQIAAQIAVGAPADKPKIATDKADPIDAKPMLDKLEVYKDDAGLYYVSPLPDAGVADLDKWVFYGDGKTFYQQRVIGSSNDKGSLTWLVWSPRARGIQNASIELSKTTMAVRCQPKDAGKKALTQLTADAAKTLLSHAKLFPPLWRRQAHFLARDDDGVYYYVDALLEDFGGKGFRVFVGQKGAMKEQAMTNVVEDSAGEIFATKTGDLKIVAGKDGKAYWKKSDKKHPADDTKTELVVLDMFPNRYLIYRELGIYGSLGVACDDQ